jgi:hypothetical protein
VLADRNAEARQSLLGEFSRGPVVPRICTVQKPRVNAGNAGAAAAKAPEILCRGVSCISTTCHAQQGSAAWSARESPLRCCHGLNFDNFHAILPLPKGS